MNRLPQLKKIRFALDRRVIWLLLAGGATVVGELSLRAWDAHQHLSNELKRAGSRIQVLQASSDRVDWTARSSELTSAQNLLQSRLWHAPSEAQAQAMLQDWLSDSFKDKDIKRLSVKLLSPQSGKPAGVDAGVSPPNAPITTGQKLAKQAIRVRALVSLELAPDSLETALQVIELSNQLANVDQLSVSRRSRRIEMTVSVPVIVSNPAALAEIKP